MYTRKVKLTIPQYRERKEIYEAFGYKEIKHVEKGFYVHLTLEIDDDAPKYYELRQYEKGLYRRGPIFLPVIILVVFAFVLLSVFVIRLAQSRKDGEFDLLSNALSLLLPAFAILVLDVIYTYFYYSINKKILERGVPTKAEILEDIEKIKNK